MGNAVLDFNAAATDYVTGDNDHDGVALVLEQLAGMVETCSTTPIIRS